MERGKVNELILMENIMRRYIIYFLLIITIFFNSNQVIAGIPNVIVFIDCSGSMSGFLSGSYAQFMKNLETTLFSAGINQVDYTIKKVGTQISDYNGRLALFGFEKNLYNEPTTNLAAVADYLRKSLPGIAIIISDWELDVAGTGTGVNECISGYDLACMRLKFSQLMRDSGYQLTVIGFKTKYDGYLYPPGEKTKIKLKSAIYRPVYFFILSKPERSVQVKEVISSFEDELSELKKNDRQLEYRKLIISPIEFPTLRFKFGSFSLETDAGKEAYLILEKKEDSASNALNIIFKKSRNITAREKIKIEIPYESSIPENSVRLFTNQFEYEWKPPLSQAQVMLDNKKLTLQLTKEINNGKGWKLSAKIVSRIDKNNLEIWRDWSASDPKSQQYLEGNTLHISDFLEYLFLYSVNLTGEKEKKVYDLTLEFKN
jgi:hypothetical protein